MNSKRISVAPNLNPGGYRSIDECRICNSKDLRLFLSLGPIPLANNILREEQLSEPEPFYPMDVCFCGGCGLVQLLQVVEPSAMFGDYTYLTSTSSPMKSHFEELAASACSRMGISKGSLIVDIGSNDGTLLTAFKNQGMDVLGIEPAANVAQIAESRGIRTINNWFAESVAEQVCSKMGHPAAILATNVFAHVHDIRGFVTGVDRLMGEDSVFIIEAPYLVDMLEKVEFDTIYHEHLSYLAIRPLVELFSMFGMTIIDVERIKVHGGSIRVYVKRGKETASVVNQLLELENKSETHKLDTYHLFAENTRRIKAELAPLLKDLKSKGATISGYGAPAKGNTLLNYCEIDKKYLDYISDTTPLKQGRYTPGTHIPIVSDERFRQSPPDFALLLAWNYADDIMRKEKQFREAGGRFILPIPKPQIV